MKLGEIGNIKLSEITEEQVKNYLRITDNDEDGFIRDIMSSALGNICEYTGLTREECDDYPDLYYAFMCICSEMYNTRDAHVQLDRYNPTVKMILGLHCRNQIM